MTVVLAIDTALNACSAAVAADGAVLAARSEAMARGQAERLAPLVQEVMAEAGVAFSALSRVAVTTGPGSFTGVRVGLSFGRTLAAALGVPCVGVGTLPALLLSAPAAGMQAACIVTPGALYLMAQAQGAALIPAQAVEKAQAAGLLANLPAGVLVGPGAEVLCAGHAQLTPVEQGWAEPARIAAFAATADPALFAPDPTYLRPPGATPPA